MGRAYEARLHEIGDGLYAYLQPDGGWGWTTRVWSAAVAYPETSV